MKLRDLLQEKLTPKMSNAFLEITEITKKLEDYDLEASEVIEFINVIKKVTDKCSDVIAEMKSSKKFLIRMIKTKVKIAGFIKKYTGKRKPIDTQKNVDEFLEKYRKKWWPDIPSRQKAYFCTTGKMTKNVINAHSFADTQYGIQAVVILPVNGTKYFQSKTVGDFTTSEIAEAISDFLYERADVKNNLARAWPQLKIKLKTKMVKHEKRLEKVLDKYFGNYIHTLKNMKHNLAEVVLEGSGYFVFDDEIWTSICKMEKISIMDVFDPSIQKDLLTQMKKIK
jgi:ribosomal protein L31